MKDIRCLLGAHRWVYFAIGPWNSWEQHVERECERCGAYENLRLVNPLSGPIKNKGKKPK